MIDYKNSADMVKNEVMEYQKATNRKVYLDKPKYWFYVGALTYCDFTDAVTILNDLKTDLANTEANKR